jgi:hypothetical protein
MLILLYSSVLVSVALEDLGDPMFGFPSAECHRIQWFKPRLVCNQSCTLCMLLCQLLVCLGTRICLYGFLVPNVFYIPLRRLPVTTMHFPIHSDLSGCLRPLRLQLFTAITSYPIPCCVRLVPLMHNLWGFRNEGLLSVPQIKHMTYATMLPSYCPYCSYCLLYTSCRIRLISVFSINMYYVLLYL